MDGLVLVDITGKRVHRPSESSKIEEQLVDITGVSVRGRRLNESGKQDTANISYDMYSSTDKFDFENERDKDRELGRKLSQSRLLNVAGNDKSSLARRHSLVASPLRSRSGDSNENNDKIRFIGETEVGRYANDGNIRMLDSEAFRKYAAGSTSQTESFSEPMFRVSSTDGQFIPVPASFYALKTVYNLDEYDESEIDKLMALGFTRHQAVEAYTYNYNEELKQGRIPKPVIVFELLSLSIVLFDAYKVLFHSCIPSLSTCMYQSSGCRKWTTKTRWLTVTWSCRSGQAQSVRYQHILPLKADRE